MARRAWIVVVLGAAALIAAVGCSPKKLMIANLPPETTLFVQGPVDTVNHVVHLYWFGSDPDGSVSRFELRFKNPVAPADTAWRTTMLTDSIFTVPAPNGVSQPTFEIRAIDNQGEVDPTPAVEDFTFSNHAPDVVLRGSPRPMPDTTFATGTLFWTATDPDGDDRLMTFRAWLDGDSAQAHVLPAGTRSFTFPSVEFQNDLGGYSSGPRTAFLQALDDGGMASVPVSFRWFVKAPVTGAVAKLLLVDDLRGTGAVDRFYRNALATVPADAYNIVEIEKLRPFRSTQDLEQTLKLYRSVIWYRDTYSDSITNVPFASTIFKNHQAAFESYLASGGRLYISSPHLVGGENAVGAFSQSFVTDFLDSDSLYKAFIPGRVDSTVNWDVVSTSTLFSARYADSLRSGGSFTGVRSFAVRSPGSVLFAAPPGSLSPANPVSMAVGVRVPQKNSGLAIILTFPLPAMTGYPGNAARVLQSVLTDLGVYAP